MIKKSYKSYKKVVDFLDERVYNISKIRDKEDIKNVRKIDEDVREIWV